ncbi:MAG: S-layer homology domain-containing protein, partial [Clostridia bacterium]|nr:S-layer homology domain-containing protein [Clostridia bacterium]
MKKIARIVSSLAVLLALTVTSLLTVSAESKMPFSDVENDWYYSAVEYVWQHGIMRGVSEKRFSPFGLTTRAEIVTILSRLSEDKTDGMSASQSFKDVVVGEWYTDPVGWGVANKIVNGYEDNTFRPDLPVSR